MCWGQMRASPLCRHELYHIQRELLRERTHCKALEEELENPMNIHRWRKLEVSPVLSVCVRKTPTHLTPPTDSTHCRAATPAPLR